MSVDRGVWSVAGTTTLDRKWRQSSFTPKVRTIFTLKIIVSIFVKLFLILVLHLRQLNPLSLHTTFFFLWSKYIEHFSRFRFVSFRSVRFRFVRFRFVFISFRTLQVPWLFASFCIEIEKKTWKVKQCSPTITWTSTKRTTHNSCDKNNHLYANVSELFNLGFFDKHDCIYWWIFFFSTLCKHVPCNTLTHSTNEDLLNIKRKGDPEVSYPLSYVRYHWNPEPVCNKSHFVTLFYLYWYFIIY
jgi:hypothetical protein